MDEIEEIKQRIDIVDLVGHYVSLKKAGANFKGLCPFHYEKSPSFMVNPERQIFKCFGCQKGGDIFAFIQEIENLEFGDALKMLADRAHVELKPRTKPKPGEAPSEKSRAYMINALASQVFHKLLVDHPAGKPALAYLKKRGLTDETIGKWRIGFAPKQKVLLDFLKKRGFTLDEIQKAGKPDMFYDRIMFPITDILGNVVGFTGRTTGQAEPKYLNTPETPIFRKSRILFGLEQAKQAIRQHNSVIIAEGQMDVISASQVGTPNIVASSGTALTADHLRILARYGVPIIFAFDNDSAGNKATERAIELALADDIFTKVIQLPKQFKDIGEVAEQDPTLWPKLASKAMPALEWQIESVLNQYKTGQIDRKLSVEEKKSIAKLLIPILRRIPDTIEQAHYIQLLARRIEVKETVIQEAMNRTKKGTGTQRANQATQAPSTISEQKSTLSLTTEEALLGLLERSQALKTQHENLYKELREWYNKPVNDLVLAVEEQYRGLSPAELKTEVELLIKRYDETKKDRLKDQFAIKISAAEQQGDRARVKQLLAEFQQLIRQ